MDVSKVTPLRGRGRPLTAQGRRDAGALELVSVHGHLLATVSELRSAAVSLHQAQVHHRAAAVLDDAA